MSTLNYLDYARLDSVFDRMMAAMERAGAVRLCAKEIDALRTELDARIADAADQSKAARARVLELDELRARVRIAQSELDQRTEEAAAQREIAGAAISFVMYHGRKPTVSHRFRNFQFKWIVMVIMPSRLPRIVTIRIDGGALS